MRPDRSEIKVHFKGWNSKFDEWLSIDSERIQPFGSSQVLLARQELEKTKACPWFDVTELHRKAREDISDSSPPSTVPLRQTQRVRIDGITEWCVDLTYANPSLWLISEGGYWYRLAGPLVGICDSNTLQQKTGPAPSLNLKSLKRKALALEVNGDVDGEGEPAVGVPVAGGYGHLMVGGGQPAAVYSRVFALTWEPYYAVAHMAFVIHDLISAVPIPNPGEGAAVGGKKARGGKAKRGSGGTAAVAHVTYAAVCEELCMRTVFNVHEFTVLEHYQFVGEQLGAVSFVPEQLQVLCDGGDPAGVDIVTAIEGTIEGILSELADAGVGFCEAGGLDHALAHIKDPQYRGKRAEILRRIRDQRRLEAAASSTTTPRSNSRGGPGDWDEARDGKMPKDHKRIAQIADIISQLQLILINGNVDMCNADKKTVSKKYKHMCKRCFPAEDSKFWFLSMQLHFYQEQMVALQARLPVHGADVDADAAVASDADEGAATPLPHLHLLSIPDKPEFASELGASAAGAIVPLERLSPVHVHRDPAILNSCLPLWGFVVNFHLALFESVPVIYSVMGDYTRTRSVSVPAPPTPASFVPPVDIQNICTLEFIYDCLTGSGDGDHNLSQCLNPEGAVHPFLYYLHLALVSLLLTDYGARLDQFQAQMLERDRDRDNGIDEEPLEELPHMRVGFPWRERAENTGKGGYERYYERNWNINRHVVPSFASTDDLQGYYLNIPFPERSGSVGKSPSAADRNLSLVPQYPCAFNPLGLCRVDSRAASNKDGGVNDRVKAAEIAHRLQEVGGSAVILECCRHLICMYAPKEEFKLDVFNPVRPRLGVVLEEYFDPVVELANIVKELLVVLCPDIIPFSRPVDEELDSAPDYYKIVKRPMDFHSLLAQLEGDHYQSDENTLRVPEAYVALLQSLVESEGGTDSPPEVSSVGEAEMEGSPELLVTGFRAFWVQFMWYEHRLLRHQSPGCVDITVDGGAELELLRLYSVLTDISQIWRNCEYYLGGLDPDEPETGAMDVEPAVTVTTVGVDPAELAISSPGVSEASKTPRKPAGFGSPRSPATAMTTVGSPTISTKASTSKSTGNMDDNEDKDDISETSSTEEENGLIGVAARMRAVFDRFIQQRVFDRLLARQQQRCAVATTRRAEREQRAGRRAAVARRLAQQTRQAAVNESGSVNDSAVVNRHGKPIEFSSAALLAVRTADPMEVDQDLPMSVPNSAPDSIVASAGYSSGDYWSDMCLQLEGAAGLGELTPLTTDADSVAATATATVVGGKIRLELLQWLCDSVLASKYMRSVMDQLERADASEVATKRQAGLPVPRMNCLGTDRDGSSYWTMQQDLGSTLPTTSGIVAAQNEPQALVPVKSGEDGAGAGTGADSEPHAGCASASTTPHRPMHLGSISYGSVINAPAPGSAAAASVVALSELQDQSTDPDVMTLLVCDGCDEEHSLESLLLNLPPGSKKKIKIPKGHWFCPKCRISPNCSSLSNPNVSARRFNNSPQVPKTPSSPTLPGALPQSQQTQVQLQVHAASPSIDTDSGSAVDVSSGGEAAKDATITIDTGFYCYDGRIGDALLPGGATKGEVGICGQRQLWQRYTPARGPNVAVAAADEEFAQYVQELVSWCDERSRGENRLKRSLQEYFFPSTVAAEADVKTTATGGVASSSNGSASSANTPRWVQANNAATVRPARVSGRRASRSNPSADDLQAPLAMAEAEAVAPTAEVSAVPPSASKVITPAKSVPTTPATTGTPGGLISTPGGSSGLGCGAPGASIPIHIPVPNVCSLHLITIELDTSAPVQPPPESKLPAVPPQSLDIGVKDINSGVLVTNFKTRTVYIAVENTGGTLKTAYVPRTVPSLGKTSGLYIGDQLLSLNGEFVSSVSALQKTVRQLYTTAAGEPGTILTLHLMVLRRSNIYDPSNGFSEALIQDKVFREGAEKHVAERVAGMAGPERGAGSNSRVVGSMVDKLLKLNHPYITSQWPASATNENTDKDSPGFGVRGLRWMGLLYFSSLVEQTVGNEECLEQLVTDARQGAGPGAGPTLQDFLAHLSKTYRVSGDSARWFTEYCLLWPPSVPLCAANVREAHASTVVLVLKRMLLEVEVLVSTSDVCNSEYWCAGEPSVVHNLLAVAGSTAPAAIYNYSVATTGTKEATSASISDAQAVSSSAMCSSNRVLQQNTTSPPAEHVIIASASRRPQQIWRQCVRGCRTLPQLALLSVFFFAGHSSYAPQLNSSLHNSVLDHNSDCTAINWAYCYNITSACANNSFFISLLRQYNPCHVSQGLESAVLELGSGQEKEKEKIPGFSFSMKKFVPGINGALYYFGDGHREALGVAPTLPATIKPPGSHPQFYGYSTVDDTAAGAPALCFDGYVLKCIVVSMSAHPYGVLTADVNLSYPFVKVVLRILAVVSSPASGAGAGAGAPKPTPTVGLAFVVCEGMCYEARKFIVPDALYHSSVSSLAVLQTNRIPVVVHNKGYVPPSTTCGVIVPTKWKKNVLHSDQFTVPKGYVMTLPVNPVVIPWNSVKIVLLPESHLGTSLDKLIANTQGGASVINVNPWDLENMMDFRSSAKKKNK